MSKHIKVNGKLLDTGKEWRNLKQKQKDKISAWLFEEYKRYYQYNGIPAGKNDWNALSEITDAVYEKIEKAEIWIPYDEVYCQLESKAAHYEKRAMKEIYTKEPDELEIEILPYEFCMARVADYSKVDLSELFTFTGSTDHEKSLICKKENLPDNVLGLDEGYAGLRIKGVLGFNLIGILAKISGILASKAISIVAVSTFDTDYIFIKQDKLEEAVNALKANRYIIN